MQIAMSANLPAELRSTGRRDGKSDDAGVPLLVLAIGHFGFPGAMMAAAIAMIVLMVPVILIFVGRPPMHLSAVSLGASDVSATQIRAAEILLRKCLPDLASALFEPDHPAAAAAHRIERILVDPKT